MGGLTIALIILLVLLIIFIFAVVIIYVYSAEDVKTDTTTTDKVPTPPLDVPATTSTDDVISTAAPLLEPIQRTINFDGYSEGHPDTYSGGSWGEIITNQTIEECVGACDATEKCLGFEYGAYAPDRCKLMYDVHVTPENLQKRLGSVVFFKK